MKLLLLFWMRFFHYTYSIIIVIVTCVAVTTTATSLSTDTQVQQQYSYFSNSSTIQSAAKTYPFINSNSLSKYRQRRDTEEEEQIYTTTTTTETQVVDLSKYTLKFEECQFVKEYSDDIAISSSYDTVLTTQRFIIFRLCPKEESSSSSECSYTSCESNYGEYLINMDEYLQATVNYFYQMEQTQCQECQEYCSSYYHHNKNQNQHHRQRKRILHQQQQEEKELQLQTWSRSMTTTINCTSCFHTCYNYVNKQQQHRMMMNNNKDNDSSYSSNYEYIDATKYLTCTKIIDGNKNGNEGPSIYFGPSCVSSGKKIQIDVFTDRNCLLRIENETAVPEDYLQQLVQEEEEGGGGEETRSVKLSYTLFEKIFDPSSCISCSSKEEEQDVCSLLYDDAGKCETKHGFYNHNNNNNNNNGITTTTSSSSSYDTTSMSNQQQQENIVCDYISSLKSGTYTQEGDIVTSGEQNTFKKLAPATTPLQKFILTVFFFGTMTLITYASILHSELTQSTKVDLASFDANDAQLV